ncbi:hypothetical protein Q0P45_14430, partial [Staphylococcus aureus]|nr:hypothetical protein [Staphylococcus aureus]
VFLGVAGAAGLALLGADVGVDDAPPRTAAAGLKLPYSESVSVTTTEVSVSEPDSVELALAVEEPLSR